jgi:thioredoxin 1
MKEPARRDFSPFSGRAQNPSSASLALTTRKEIGMSTTEITTQSFEAQVKKEGIVFIDWWASWCGPCRAFAPIYEKTASAHPDITWGKVDTEAQPELSAAFGIRAIPTLMVFRDGILLFEQPGLVPAKALESLVEQVRQLDMDDVRRKVSEHEKSQQKKSHPDAERAGAPH